jgi:TonB-dependent SusC/RagA subfamily outer membrane receptor
LKNVLTELERKYKVYFTFESAVLQQKYISPDVELGQGLEESLHNVLSPYGLQYRKISERYYSIFPAEAIPPAPAPQLNAIPSQTSSLENLARLGTIVLPAANPLAVTITGRVTDDKESGIPGVNVLLKGSVTGTTTNTDGSYSLSIPEVKAGSGILVFSFIGYVTEEIPLNGRNTIDVTMIADIKSLNEVVVVGYGTQQKKDLTTAISSVKGAEINAIPTLSPGQALAGKMAGITLQQASGAPGSAPVIRIRGNGSITSGNNPLYVIDGYPTSDVNLFNNIPPSDIESIDVLKDAASAAIYGSRAGNGVIVVTTKRGKEGNTRLPLTPPSARSR